MNVVNVVWEEEERQIPNAAKRGARDKRVTLDQHKLNLQSLLNLLHLEPLCCLTCWVLSLSLSLSQSTL